MAGKILVVEDEAYARKSLTELLAVGGYAVDTAKSGKEALRKLDKDEFDLILSDIKMPGMDGVELLEKIKKKHDHDVIMITGHADLENAIASLKLGAYDFIRKPYDNEEILNSIKRSLERQRLEREVKKSEQKYRALTENANDAIFIASPEDGRFMEVNRKAEELTGYTREELLNMSSFEIYPEEERERNIKSLQKALRAGSGIIGDANVLRKDGTTVSANISVSVINYDENKVIQSIYRDITQRKKLEQQLKKYSEHLEQMVEEKTREIEEMKGYMASITEGSADGIMSTDLKGNIKSWNKGAEEMLGYKAEEIVGKHYYATIPEELREGVDAARKEALEKGFVRNFETYQSHKDGTPIPVNLTITAIKDAKGNIIGTSGVFKDMSEKKKAEEEIRRLKEFNENIVRKMEEGIVIEDSEGRITFANPRMEELLGFSKEELVGTQWLRIIPSGYQKRVEEETRKSLEGVKSRYEAALLSKEGKEIPAIISTTPLFENGAFNGVLSVITDIKGRKKAEDEMIQKMMRYRVEKGGAYLVKEKELERGMDVLLDLLKCGYKGLIITRTPPEEIKKLCPADVPVMWLSEERYDEMTIPPRFFLMEKTIENYAERDVVVLLDRLDYLISKNGFKETMKFVQRLNEIFFIARGILIITIDPAILSPRELSFLEKEVAELRLKHEPDFPEDLYEILEFVYEQNRVGRKPAHKDVEERFKITRTTGRKRINRLKHLGLVEDRRWGKYKVLRLTEKGKAYF